MILRDWTFTEGNGVQAYCAWQERRQFPRPSCQTVHVPLAWLTYEHGPPEHEIDLSGSTCVLKFPNGVTYELRDGKVTRFERAVENNFELSI